MTNQELIVESKYQSAKTTENLKKSLKELEEAKELGENSLITIKLLKPVPNAFILKLSDYKWVPGTALDDKMRVAH